MSTVLEWTVNKEFRYRAELAGNPNIVLPGEVSPVSPAFIFLAELEGRHASPAVSVFRRTVTSIVIDGRTPEETADGFIAIAVAKMAEAIKKISVARGYDVTRYALNCFGGAGGQHAGGGP